MNVERKTMTLDEVETLARNFSESRTTLAERVQQLQYAQQASLRLAQPGIESALRMTKAAQQELETAIAANPGLFKKPKTLVFHGVKIGFEKGKGKLQIDDVENTIKLIRKHLKEKFSLLVKTTLKPQKKAISGLKVEELKKIGVEVEAAGDQVVVRPVDSELDKTIKALLEPDAKDASQDDDE